MKKAELYTSHLVPAAQVLLIVSRILKSVALYDKRYAPFHHLLMQQEMDILNLINCEVQSWSQITPRTQSKMDSLAQAIDSRIAGWKSELQQWATVLNVSYASKSKLAPKSNAYSQLILSAEFQPTFKVEPSLEFRERLQALVREKNPHARIFTLLDYEPKKRVEWLKLRTAHSTPLREHARINGWKTLARNLPFYGALSKLQVEVKGSPSDQRAQFGSRVGRAQVQDLFHAAFGESVSSACSAILKTERSKPIPNYVTVELTSDGYLKLTATCKAVDKHSLCVPQEEGLFEEYLAVASVQAKKELIQTVQTFVLCGADKVQEAVEALESWHASQTSICLKIRTEFQEFKSKRETEALSGLLSKFSTQELELLQKHFSGKQ